MTHICPVCNKWVPKIHIGNHFDRHKDGNFSYTVAKALHIWIFDYYDWLRSRKLAV